MRPSPTGSRPTSSPSTWIDQEGPLEGPPANHYWARTNLPRTGNPVGTNAEITAVLAGNNKLQLALIPADHPAINRSTGELLDRWGTPFFFHAESGSRMEIRSAGPDKKHHTADDEAFIP